MSDKPAQQLGARPAIAAAIQTGISSANTITITGKRIDRTPGFNDKSVASGLFEVNLQRETDVRTTACSAVAGG